MYLQDPRVWDPAFQGYPSCLPQKSSAELTASSRIISLSICSQKQNIYTVNNSRISPVTEMIFFFVCESHLVGGMLNSFNSLYAWVAKLYLIHFTCHNIHTALWHSVCPCRDRASGVGTSSGKGIINNSISSRGLRSIDQQPRRGLMRVKQLPASPTLAHLDISSPLAHWELATGIQIHLFCWRLVIKGVPAQFKLHYCIITVRWISTWLEPFYLQPCHELLKDGVL